MLLSLHAASRLAGIQTSMVLRAIVSGELSATLHHDGAYIVDSADLDRAFPKGKETKPAAAAYEPIRVPGIRHAPFAAELAGLLEILITADAAFGDYVDRMIARAEASRAGVVANPQEGR